MSAVEMQGVAATGVRTAVDGRWEHDPLLRRVRTQLPLLAVWTRREFRVRYRQSALGITWSIVQPLATLAIFGIILRSVLHVSSEGYPYISFAYAGLVPWTFALNGIGTAVPSIMNAAPVAGKAYFPREVITIATVGVSAIDLAISTALFFIIIGIQGVGFSYHLIAMIPIFLVLAIIVLGLGIFLAVLTVFLRDLRYLVPLVLQLLFIATPIMYPPSLLKGKLAIFARINPFAAIVDAVRQVALAKQWPDWPLLGVHAAIGLVFLFVVLLYTRSVEPRLVDVM
ncbi:MAG: ABC transporter permease [Acidimicrobiales bacterium]|jgi:lipopolysaccharide transport system permease protein